MKSLTLILGLGLLALTSASPKVDPSIASSLESHGTVNILLSMTYSQHPELRAKFNTMKRAHSTRADLLKGFRTLMKNQADKVQSPVVQELLKLKSSANPELVLQKLWITNQIIVKNANLETVSMLSDLLDVSAIEEEKFLPLPDFELQPLEGSQKAESGETTWSIAETGAPEVWTAGNTGHGAVVADIATGVRYTHQALRDTWRSSHGWFDPAENTTLPNDSNGLGTHAMGVLVGRWNDFAGHIGMAPGASWISCKGCSSSSCSNFDLLTCGQWMACPTQPDGSEADCSKAPDVVANAWGGGSGDNWFEGVVQSWYIVGIVPIFVGGSSGPSCGSASSPGDSVWAVAVGSYAQNGDLASSNSRGPGAEGQIKPDVVAPGSGVVSAYYSSDNAYATLSGTAIAGPHAAGVVALIRAAKADLDTFGTVEALTGGCIPVVGDGTGVCGGVSDKEHPNNVAGWGRVNALRSVNFEPEPEL